MKKASPANSNRNQSSATGSILVDLENGTVGGVNLRQDGESLERTLGRDRVHKATELLEGQSNDVYVVRFGDHEVYRHWNAFSYKDPVFMTRDGLGPDSSIMEFENIYGKGQLVEEEGCAIHFRMNARSGHFAIACPTNDSSTNDSHARALASEIWVW
jgi:hypothetical protein